MKKVAVILSGCGVYDGAEIHESVLTLLALDRAQATAVCTAPDIPQHHVVNHLTGEPAAGETRNVLVESARIARGKIQPLSQLNPTDVDAVILPGGFGAAKNLCNFALAGADFEVNPEVAAFVKAAHQAGKPVGFICIAPAIAARLFGPEQAEFTIGTDAGTADALQAAGGGRHVNCTVHNVVVDQRLKIVSTPAYMLAGRITEAEAGINKLVQAVLEMA
jgi:enhancing lycopene biosynthesis protein 2